MLEPTTFRDILYGANLFLPGFLFAIALWGCIDNRAVLLDTKRRPRGLPAGIMILVIAAILAFSTMRYLLKIPSYTQYTEDPTGCVDLLQSSLLSMSLLTFMFWPAKPRQEAGESKDGE